MFCYFQLIPSLCISFFRLVFYNESVMLTHRQNTLSTITGLTAIQILQAYMRGRGSFTFSMCVCLILIIQKVSDQIKLLSYLFYFLKTAISGSPGKNRCPTPPPNSGPPKDLIYWSFRHRQIVKNNAGLRQIGGLVSG